MSEKTNCPNCGAPIALGKSKCPYCDTPYHHIRFNYSGPYSIPAKPIDMNDVGTIAGLLALGLISSNEARRRLRGLPPIGRKNGKSLGPHTLMEVDVNELMKEEKDV